LLLYHRGLIAAASGDRDDARRWLTGALAGQRRSARWAEERIGQGSPRRALPIPAAWDYTTAMQRERDGRAPGDRLRSDNAAR